MDESNDSSNFDKLVNITTKLLNDFQGNEDIYQWNMQKI